MEDPSISFAFPCRVWQEYRQRPTGRFGELVAIRSLAPTTGRCCFCLRSQRRMAILSAPWMSRLNRSIQIAAESGCSRQAQREPSGGLCPPLAPLAEPCTAVSFGGLAMLSVCGRAYRHGDGLTRRRCSPPARSAARKPDGSGR
jgi:hypothetical protein